MSKRSRITWATLTLAAAALAGWPSAARAQRTLTLDEALSTAHRANRDLAQARARVEEAHAGVLTAWSALLPVVTTQGKYTHNYKEVTLPASEFTGATVGLANVINQAIPAIVSDPTAQAQAQGAINGFINSLNASTPANIVIQKGEQLDYVLAATVPLLVPSAYPGLSAAKRTEEAGRANLAVSDAQVLYSTAQAYYACAGADELVTARLHAVDVAQKALDNAKARLEAGVVNRVEVSRAELQLVRAKQALLESQDTQVQTYRALGTIMNMHEPVRVIAAESAPPDAAAVETLTAQALQLRPEFPALQLTIESNKLTASSNLWRWAPTISAFGNLRAFNYAGFSGDNYSWAVGLQLDWTIYDGGLRDANRKLARAQQWENEAKLDLLRDQVRDDVFNARRTLTTKRRALETARRSQQLSKETLDLVQVQHDAGTATQLDLLQAQDNLVAAEVALAQARFDLSLGGLQLDRLSGAFPANLNLK
ncbi:MAG TPA: TolC family protein [Polyangia bacterium]|jgi:outer membrane protein TolC